MNQGKIPRILVSPLEWGLGHATRLAAVIVRLTDMGCEVIIAADGLPYTFLSRQFPQLKIIRLPFAPIHYAPAKKGFFLKLWIQLPRILRAIRQTRRALKSIVQQESIDHILADNRYGFCHAQVPSVFITHQLRPQPPRGWTWLDTLFSRLIHQPMIREFDYWWIPDYAGEPNVCGRLSHIANTPYKIRYIDPVSWLPQISINEQVQGSNYDLLCLISGPEPQRSLFESLVIEILEKATFRSVVLQGLPHPVGEQPKTRQQGHVTIYNHLPGNEIKELLLNSPHILCRAGVVTVFDLAALGVPALLIPTPGQTEQEYVAKHVSEAGYFDCCYQEELNLERIEGYRQKSFSTFPTPNPALLDQAINEWLNHPTK